MRLTRFVRIQLGVLAVLSLIVITVMAVNFMQIPTTFFGVGRYTVTMELPQTGGLYEGGTVTYRGVQVGKVDAVRLTENGVEAALSLTSDVEIPADLDAAVHSVSGVGEQYVELSPRRAEGPPLKDGDVIPQPDTSVPPDISSLLTAANRGLKAIPGDNLKTVIDESYAAVGGLGPELSRLVTGTTRLAIDANKNLDSMVALIDRSKPVLDSQTETAGSIQAWAANLATITAQLKTADTDVRGLLQTFGPMADEMRQSFDRLQPTLPILLANLVSVGDVAVTYRGNLEQILVVVPQLVAASQAINVANMNSKQAYRGAYLSFNLNVNLPPPCTTGYPPAQQRRSPVFEDAPELPDGIMYCRIPQDAPNAVRGARNTPCVTRPGKRAPTVKMCESDEVYVPLNEGFNWKGDPNATTTGQGVPQLPPGSGPPVQQPPPPNPAPPPIAVAEYDTETGRYVGPDGQVYTQANLARGAGKERTWQTMLTPPSGN